MKRLEVRCCCQPQKLLGWLTVSDELAVPGRRIVSRRTARVGLQSEFDPTAPIVPVPTRVDTLELPVEKITVDGQRYTAIKAEGCTVERLREMLPDFETAGSRILVAIGDSILPGWRERAIWRARPGSCVEETMEHPLRMELENWEDDIDWHDSAELMKLVFIRLWRDGPTPALILQIHQPRHMLAGKPMLIFEDMLGLGISPELI